MHLSIDLIIILRCDTSICVIHVSRSSWFSSGLETLLLGGTCATVAFTIGYYVNQLLGEDDVDDGL